MPDDIDQANDLAEEIHEKRIANIRRAAQEIPKGYIGICEICEDEEPTRLVQGECSRCRDQLLKRNGYE